MKTIITTLSVVLLLASCKTDVKDQSQNGSDSIQVSTSDGHNSQNSLTYTGTYKGTLPCASCDGIETTLTLVDDKNFTKKMVYLGEKSNNVFETKGTYSFDKSGSVITLKAKGEEDYMLKIGENVAIMLDKSGKEITGDLSENYKLNKVLETANSTSLEGKKFKLVELNGKPIGETRKEMFIQFLEKGRFAAKAGCNNLGGDFKSESEMKVSFSKVFSTMMACPDGMDTESVFTAALEKVDSYSLQDGKLQLYKAKMAPLAVFELVP